MELWDELLRDLMHGLVVGPTGTGKSKFIEGAIRQLALRPDEPSIVLLDPGGSTARSMERWLTECGLTQRALLFDPDEDRHFLGYNPLQRVSGLPDSLQARYVSGAIQTALELDDQDSVFHVPMLQQTLQNLAQLLIESGFTLREAPYILSAAPTAEAETIIEQAETPAVQSFWRDLQNLKPQQRQQILGVAQARLLPFVNSELISHMLSQQSHSLDFSEAIEQGNIMLFNTEPYTSLTPTDSKLLSNLIISDVVKACFSRPAYTGRDCYLIIEESGEGLIGPEIGKMLRRARKQGLHVILLNQDLSSMREEQPVVFRQLWANAAHKVVFGDLPDEDLELVAREFFLEDMDPHALKDRIYRTFFAPHETTRTIVSESEGYASSHSQGHGDAASTGQVFTEEGMVFPMENTLHHHSSSGTSEFEGTSEGYSEMRSESTVPWYEHEERQELSSQTFYSIEELVHLAKQQLRGLGKRQICLKQRGQSAQLFEVPWVDDVPEVESYGEQARDYIFNESACYSTIEEVQQEESARQQQLHQLTGAEESDEEPDHFSV